MEGRGKFNRWEEHTMQLWIEESSTKRSADERRERVVLKDFSLRGPFREKANGFVIARRKIIGEPSDAASYLLFGEWQLLDDPLGLVLRWLSIRS